MTNEATSRVLSGLPNTALAAAYDGRTGLWRAVLEGALAVEAEAVRIVAALGPTADAAVANLHAAIAAMGNGSRLVAGLGTADVSEWRLAGDAWERLPTSAATALAEVLSGKPRIAVPGVDESHALNILDTFVDTRIGEGSPMSTAWYEFNRAARRAAPGYHEYVVANGVPPVPEGTSPAAQAIRLMVEAGIAAKGIPPEQEIDRISALANQALSAGQGPRM